MKPFKVWAIVKGRDISTLRSYKKAKATFDSWFKGHGFELVHIEIKEVKP